MPGYKGHLVGGGLAFGALYLLLQQWCPSTMIAAHWFCCSLAGALFPDIDVKSKGQKYGYWILLVIFILLILENKLELLALLSILSVVPMLVRHRGLFHRRSFVIGMPLMLWVIVSASHPAWTQALFFYTLFFIIGALSHLFLDFGFFRMMR
jgi:hypothetical protein